MSITQSPEDATPYGRCRCGCDQQTSIAIKNHTRNGYVKGQPMLYVRGHYKGPHSDRQPSIQHQCVVCGNSFRVPVSKLRRSDARFCSNTCYGKWRSSEDAFWLNVEKTDYCWLWLGAPNEDGYGRFGTDLAHRKGWEFQFGPIPDGEGVLHHCDVRLCVRGEHLFTGTHQDNMDDMVAKGRQAAGPRKRPYLKHKDSVRLTTEQVDEVRSLWSAGGTSTYKLGAMFSVSPVTISNIVNNRHRVNKK